MDSIKSLNKNAIMGESEVNVRDIVTEHVIQVLIRKGVFQDGSTIYLKNDMIVIICNKYLIVTKYSYIFYSSY